MSEVTKKIIRILAIFLPLVASPAANSQYLSDTDAQRKAVSEKNDAKRLKINAVVGKIFWYRPGNSDSFRTKFYEKAGPMGDGLFSSNYIDFTGMFYLTKETSFKILQADFDKIKIEFDDGKIAFIKANKLAENGNYSLIENLYPGRQNANNFQAYIYPDAPFKIENPAPFVALDSIVGKRFWYRPISNTNAKLNFVDEIKTETPFVIESYKVAPNTIDIKVQLDDGATRLLKIEKATFANFSGNDLPFVYVSKDKYVPTKEYLYPGPPNEVFAAEETAFAARAAAAAKEKAAAGDERNRVRNEAIATLTKELKAAPRGFEVRGVNLGTDHHQDVADSKSFVNGKGWNPDEIPDTRIEKTPDGGTLYFYRDILFIATYEDLQDTLEIRAAMNQLEKKFKGKFAAVPQKKSRDGNTETTTGGLRLSIGNFGVAEVKLSSSRPISRNACIDNIGREMRLNITRGIKNYSSLSDRVESECRETSNPTQMVFINKPIETLVNSRANAERQINRLQAAEERLKAANEKAKKF